MTNHYLATTDHLSTNIRLCKAFLKAIAEERELLQTELEQKSIDEDTYEITLNGLLNDELFLKDKIFRSRQLEAELNG